MKKTNINKISFFLLFFALSFFVTKVTLASSLSYKLRGSFLIQVEDKGKAWYVDTENGLKHRLDNNESSWKNLHSFSLGISQADLKKIPIAVNRELINQDSDKDGLDDALEKAIGTNPYDRDSDGDSYNDSEEILAYYNPLGKGRLVIDKDKASKLSGKVLLDVERNGEAWYVNPKDNLRYYIASYKDLFKVIRVLGLGIDNKNLELIVNSESIKDKENKSIKVDVGKAQLLHYFLDGIEIGSFSVSAGKYSTPTPKGEFKIINRNRLAWSSYGLWMPYWMGLGTGSFGFHELPIWPSGFREGESHLGIPVSHGCIRLGIGPAEFLYNWAEIGTKVEIY